MNALEKEFLDIYGASTFQRVKQYIVDNDLEDCYNARKNTVETLLDFGYHFGILPIVSFCYVYKRHSVSIHNFIDNYYKEVSSVTDCVEKGLKRDSFLSLVPATSGGENSRIIFGTTDKYTKQRLICTDYLIRMIKFSNYRVHKGKFLYSIVPKYIEHYRLMDIVF